MQVLALFEKHFEPCSKS